MKENSSILKNKFNLTGSTKEDQDRFLRELVKDDQASDRMLSWGGKLALENRNWDLAEILFSCLLERRSKPNDLIGLAQALFKQKRFEEAGECLFSALDQVPEPCHLLFIIYKNLGVVHFEAGHFSLAEEFYNKAYTISPHSISLKFHKAFLSLRQKHYSLAEKQFQTILIDEPQYVSAWMGLALARYSLKETELAKACLYRCLDLKPQYKKALQLKYKWNSQLTPAFTHQFKFSF